MRLFEFAQEHSLTESDSPVAGAITRRIMMQRSDLLQKYGPQKVMAAIDDVSDFVGDTEEIGSSDVSGWVRQVEQTLDGMGSDVDEADMSRRGFLKFGAAAALGAAGVGAATNAQAGANDTTFINKVQQQHFAMIEQNPRYAKEHADLNITIVRGMSGASAENNKQWAQKTAQLLQKYGVKVNEGVSEAGRYGSRNPDTMSATNYDSYQQDQMDQGKRDFKRREMQHELGHEDDPNFERNLRQQQIDKDRGPWYIRIDGRIYKQKGVAKSFDWKRGANNYALAMVKNNPTLQGKVMLSKSAEDK
jgi:hypothetical protein